jgi:hypothetical protein
MSRVGKKCIPWMGFSVEKYAIFSSCKKQKQSNKNKNKVTFLQKIMEVPSLIQNYGRTFIDTKLWAYSSVYLPRPPSEKYNIVSWI